MPRLSGFVVALCLVCARPAIAQTPAPQLQGSVIDQLGGVVARAEVSLTGSDGKKHKTHTDREGVYTFRKLGPGRYTLQVKYPGFHVPPTEVVMGDENQLHDISARLGGLSETITVTSQTRSPGAKSNEPPTMRPTPTCKSTTAGGRPLGGLILPPLKVRHVPPTYPPRLREAGIEGSVHVEGVVGEDGRVRAIRVVSASHDLFSKAATAVILEWLYDPVNLNCRPQSLAMSVDVHFVR